MKLSIFRHPDGMHPEGQDAEQLEAEGKSLARLPKQVIISVHGAKAA